MEEHKISVGIFWGKKGRLLMKASAISALQFETGAIKEEWLKVTRAIIGMKFTVPISVTLNSDDFYPAISIDRIQNVVFSPSTESGKIIMSPSKFREKVLGSTSEEIREEFRHLLRQFLEKQNTEKLGIVNSRHPMTVEKLYLSTMCPGPDVIEVVETS